MNKHDKYISYIEKHLGDSGKLPRKYKKYMNKHYNNYKTKKKKLWDNLPDCDWCEGSTYDPEFEGYKCNDCHGTGKQKWKEIKGWICNYNNAKIVKYKDRYKFL